MATSTAPHPLIDPENWTSDDWTYYFNLIVECGYEPFQASAMVEEDREIRARRLEA